MRTARKNKVRLYYSLQGTDVPIYETDENGDVVYEEIEGVQVPVESGDTFTGFLTPVQFYGNLSYYTGWNYPGVWGVTLNNADAVLLMDKNEIPINETSRIWYTSTPVTKTVQIYDEETGEMVEQTFTDPDSADFSVSRVLPSLGCVRYILKGIER